MNRLAECREYWKTPVTWSYSLLLSRAVVRWNVSSRGVDPRGRHLKRNHLGGRCWSWMPPSGSNWIAMAGRNILPQWCWCGIDPDDVWDEQQVTSSFSVVMLLDSSRSWFETEVHGLNALQGHRAVHTSWFGWFSASTKNCGLLPGIRKNPVGKLRTSPLLRNQSPAAPRGTPESTPQEGRYREITSQVLHDDEPLECRSNEDPRGLPGDLTSFWDHP